MEQEPVPSNTAGPADEHTATFEYDAKFELSKLNGYGHMVCLSTQKCRYIKSNFMCTQLPYHKGNTIG